MSDTADVTAGTPTRFTACVKWFNSKSGYGFLTTSDGADAGEDIFVHHSAIKVSEEQYKYLVQGEYVSYTKVATDNSSHAFQAGNVTGVGGHKLMCETRNVMRDQHGAAEEGGNQEWSGYGGDRRSTGDRRSGYTQHSEWGSSVPVLVRGQGPRGADEEWMLVRRNRHVDSQRRGGNRVRRNTGDRATQGSTTQGSTTQGSVTQDRTAQEPTEVYDE